MPESTFTSRSPPLGMTREPGERWSRFARRIANAFGLVLLLVLLTYVFASVTAYSGWAAVVTVALAAASAAIALASARARPPLVRWGARLAAVAVLLAVINAAVGSSPLLGVSSLIQMLLLTVAAGAVLRAVVTETEVGFRTILGAISVYLIFGLLFTFLYVGVDRLQSGPFFAGVSHLGRGDYVFFSFTTLTTTGYGNLVPANQPGKMFSGLEMLLGQIFLVTLIAGLVSLWRPGQVMRLRREDSKAPEA
ncbi:MAG TPA: ion channel [Thermoleophilaceae bacterium]